VSPPPDGKNIRNLLTTMISDSSSSRAQTWRELILSPKYVALVILIAQTAAVVLLMRKSQLESRYMTTTAVVCSEVVKIIGGFLMARREQDTKTIIRDIFTDKRDLLMISIPGLLYTLQNNLTYVALNNLSSAVYQLTYQLKVLTTGLLSVILLGKVLSRNKWFSLVLLAFGVGLIQILNQGGEHEAGNALLGLIAVLAACCTSALAGVSLEKMIKGTPKSVWTRSIQVAIWGLLLSTIGAFIQDGDQIMEKGFFYDYTGVVWLVVLVQAVGGMVVAAVMKYADNILKCFANATSIVLIIVFEGGHGLSFLPGTTLVILASTIYGLDRNPVEMLKPYVGSWFNVNFSKKKDGYVGITVNHSSMDRRNTKSSNESDLSRELATLVGNTGGEDDV